jgi:hypothetical protein
MVLELKSLPRAQKAAITRHLRSWDTVPLLTGAADRSRAENAIREVYKATRLDAPAISWCDSPLSMALARAIVLHESSCVYNTWFDTEDKICGENLFAFVDLSKTIIGDPLYCRLRWTVNTFPRFRFDGMVSSSIIDWMLAMQTDSERSDQREATIVPNRITPRSGNILMAVSSAVVQDARALISDSVWQNAIASAEQILHKPLSEHAKHCLRYTLASGKASSFRYMIEGAPADCGYGQHEAFWLAIPSALAKIGVAGEWTEKINALADLSRNAGWYLPHRRVVWLSERPVISKTDADGRLHCPSGPALSYPDGWKVYLWHGVIVTEKIICAHETITPDDIDSEANVEVRRVMIERYGEERYLIDGGATIIDIDPEFGTLYRKGMDDDEPLVMVKVINSTPEPDGTYKPYFLRVPPDVRTARDAVAWTFGLTGSEYSPLIET